MEIKALTPDTAALAAYVEASCLDTAWSESDLKTLSDSAVYLVALDEKKCEGIACMYVSVGEASINNIAVLPEYRRRGIALSLINALITAAKERGAEFITLEVGVENTPAVNLYKRVGFCSVGQRKNFYGIGKDALIMRLDLC